MPRPTCALARRPNPRLRKPTRARCRWKRSRVSLTFTSARVEKPPPLLRGTLALQRVHASDVWQLLTFDSCTESDRARNAAQNPIWLAVQHGAVVEVESRRPEPSAIGGPAEPICMARAVANVRSYSLHGDPSMAHTELALEPDAQSHWLHMHVVAVAGFHASRGRLMELWRHHPVDRRTHTIMNHTPQAGRCLNALCIQASDIW